MTVRDETPPPSTPPAGGTLRRGNTRAKTGLLPGLLAGANPLLWLLTWSASHRHALLPSIGLLAYGFGLRDAADADHTSAIDTNRKLLRGRSLPVGLRLTLVVFAASVPGCAGHSPGKAAAAMGIASPKGREEAAAAAMGSAFQKSGIMSRRDYIRARGLAHSVARTHAISDGDLDWTLGLLKSARSPTAREHALNALCQIRPMPPAQRAKILPAIAPSLSSPDTLEQLAARRVQEAARVS